MSSVHHKPFRLPPVKTLRVHAPNGARERPCVAIMSSVLACWASAGYSTASCAQVEQALRACMDEPKAAKPRSSEVNYHLSRFQDRVSQPASKANKKKNK